MPAIYPRKDSFFSEDVYDSRCLRTNGGGDAWDFGDCGARLAHAQTTNVQFGINTSPVQSGFTLDTATSTPISAPGLDTANGFTISFVTGSGRDRGAFGTSSSVSNLYESQFTQMTRGQGNGTSPNPANAPTTQTTVTFNVTGLNANTTYSVGFWSYDPSNNPSDKWTWYNALTGAQIGTITNTTTIGSPSTLAAPTSLSQFFTSGTATTDATGKLSFGVFDGYTGGSGSINGFQIGVPAAAPEPGSALFLLGGVMTALPAGRLLRRRKPNR